MDRCLNRPVVRVEHDAVKLVHPVDLRPHIPLGPAADVALDTPDARVRRRFVGDKLWLHYKMALLAAELDGFGVLESTVTAESADEQKDEREREKNKQRSPASGVVQIEDRICGDMGVGILSPPPPFDQHPDKDDQQAESQDARKQDISDEDGIRIVFA